MKDAEEWSQGVTSAPHTCAAHIMGFHNGFVCTAQAGACENCLSYELIYANTVVVHHAISQLTIHVCVCRFISLIADQVQDF